MRPCVVVQSNIFTPYSPTLILVPLTSNIKKPFPSEFIIKASSHNGLTTDSRFLWSQIITLDQTFIVKKVGSLEDTYHELVKHAIQIALDIDDEF
jgi:mRNA interferase MazF